MVRFSEIWYHLVKFSVVLSDSVRFGRVVVRFCEIWSDSVRFSTVDEIQLDMMGFGQIL